MLTDRAGGIPPAEPGTAAAIYECLLPADFFKGVFHSRTYHRHVTGIASYGPRGRLTRMQWADPDRELADQLAQMAAGKQPAYFTAALFDSESVHGARNRS